MTSITVHSASWVVPVQSPVIENGALACDDTHIIEVGRAAEIQKKYPRAAVSRHEQAALTPPLVNAHIHLELSHLNSLSLASSPLHFTDWIYSLIALRNQLGATGPYVEDAAKKCVIEQYQTGVGLIADIGNTRINQSLAAVFNGRLLAFKEYLGFSGRGLNKILSRLHAEPHDQLCSAHAVYSTHKLLLQALKKRADTLAALFPVHVAEPYAEIELMNENQGELVEFLTERGFWDPNFADDPDRTRQGSVAYLHKIGCLNERTLCVHGVHVSDEEIVLLSETGAKVCVCPGSNRFLHVGKAPVEKYIAAGIQPGLGTDSFASNPVLSIWREMQILHQEHPEVDCADIFAMATLWGARSLGMEDKIGALAPGSNADLLAVPVPGGINTEKEVLSYLVSGGRAIIPAWIHGRGEA